LFHIERKVTLFTNLTNSAKAFLFYAIAFGLTVMVSLLYPVIGEMAAFIHMYTPTLSVLIMMLVVTRDGYSRAGWATLGLHRLGLRWWSLALIGPLVVMSTVYGIVWNTTVAQFVVPNDFTLARLATNVAMGIGISSALGLGEEIGFRGYLLPRLTQLGTTRALLLSGLMHAIWHFPLMLLTPFYPILGNWFIVGPIILLTLTTAGVFYGYLQLSSKSVWPSTLAHGVVNTAFDFFPLFTFTAVPLALDYLAGETGMITLAATALSAGAILYRLRRRRGALAVQAPSAV
jgi:membrane protease YdiL (CAAX protease family)